MDSSVNPKLEKVLNKLLEPNFKIKNEVYLNQLLTHITGKSCDSQDRRVLDDSMKELLIHWVTEITPRCRKASHPDDVLQFVMDVTAAVSVEEIVFVNLNSSNIFEKLFEVAKDATMKKPAMQLSYIRMINSILGHKSGIQWIMSYSSWINIVALILNNPVPIVFKGSCQALMTLLERMADFNFSLCSAVVQHILEPLASDNVAKHRDICEDSLYQYLKPTFDLLLFVFDWLLKKASTNTNNKLTLLFLDNFKMRSTLLDIKPSKNKRLIFKVHQLLFHMAPLTYMRLFHGLSAVVYNQYDKIYQEYLEIFSIMAETQLTKDVLECCFNIFVFWRRYNEQGNITPRMLCNKGTLLTIEDQLLVILLFVVGVRVSMYFVGDEKGAKVAVFEEDEIRDLFLTKVLASCLPQTVAICYKLDKCWPKDRIFVDAIVGLNYIIATKLYCTIDMANTSMQFMIYALKDICVNLKKRPVMWQNLGNDFFRYTTLLLEAMIVFIREFNITWWKSVESICVLNIAFNMLSYPYWPKNLVVKGLELVDVAISKYMSPNMALLIDKVHDSVMGVLGPMLYAKLHDSHWEVRDSALEVICTIAYISNKKFPSYRKVIQEAEFPSMVTKLAIKDSEAFVRASALRCMKEMIQVEEFWCDLVTNMNILEEILNALLYESEGIVRSEAAAVVAIIYEHQDVPEMVLGRMYDVAAHATTADLHWEVKVKALTFWSKVIEKHLTHQGMIDGTFPEVTFSKENRKIVTLNNAEVKKRLIKVLEQLSATGCLAVFAATLQDDSELEVAKTALDLIKHFVAMLKKYNVSEQDLNASTPASPLDSFISSPFPSEHSVRSQDSQYETLSPTSDICDMELAQSIPVNDAVLESILDSQDINLLEDVSSTLTKNSFNIRGIQVMPPRQFLNLIYGDLEGQLKERNRWLQQIDSIDSLLDDILKDYEGDVNSMDCY